MSAFVVTNETMDDVVTAIMYEKRYFADLDTQAGAHIGTEIGRKLFELNHDAVTQRYGEHHELPGSQEFHTYRWTPGRSAQGLDGGRAIMCQWVKSIDCLIYQCSEGNVPDNPTYAELEQFSHLLCRKILRGLREYRGAQWDRTN